MPKVYNAMRQPKPAPGGDPDAARSAAFQAASTGASCTRPSCGQDAHGEAGKMPALRTAMPSRLKTRLNEGPIL